MTGEREGVSEPGKTKPGRLAASLAAIDDFLPCPTPDAWIDAALANLPLLLIDHANCEKKAASTALSLIYRYSDRFDLLSKMSRLAREELRHFEQVIQLMKNQRLLPLRDTGDTFADISVGILLSQL